MYINTSNDAHRLKAQKYQTPMGYFGRHRGYYKTKKGLIAC